MIYELINPSDPVTLEADDLTIARAACLLLGRGAYALEDENGAEAMPLLLFDSFDRWASDNSFDLSEILKKRESEIAACLRSFVCVSIADRRAILAAMNGDPAALARYSDEKRSSLNDICGRAHQFAEAMTS